MLLSVDISEKSFGGRTLYSDVNFDVQDKEKIGIIGRNGTGKSTLFNILIGNDEDYQGSIQFRKGTIIVASRQEHHGFTDKTTLEYIKGDLPEYSHLTHVIDTYPHTMGTNERKIQQYSDALERFSSLGYYQLESELEQLLEKYQLEERILHAPLGSLSGGQKRMIELIKVQQSRGHIALIDEPTNHMDYVAKDTFVRWLTETTEAVLVVTHDRDVLNVVDKIIEIRDGRSYSFPGNYNSYLRANSTKITSEIGTYDQIQRRIRTLREDVVRFKRMKERARDPGTIRRFKTQERKAQDELSTLTSVERPSFWIDQETASHMSHKVIGTYDRYKATNIKVRTRASRTEKERKNTGQTLVDASNLSLGYGDVPLFTDVHFSLHEGERLRLHGRNGAGKTTLINAIIAKAYNHPSNSQHLRGTINVARELRVGVYEQEFHQRYMSVSLSNAIDMIYQSKQASITHQRISQLLSDYLFDPITDADTPVEQLSGGQKARIQLIAMLVDDPQLLILDEPTNHLDLPSIEELENSLLKYRGAIIYVSHDSFFAKKLRGDTLELA